MNEIQCYLAQYIPNLLRRESTNVGLIVRQDSQIVARFFAEYLDKNSNRRIEKSIAKKRVLHPGIYKQWVDVWRYKLEGGLKGLESILENENSNFVIVPAATVSNLSGGSLLRLLDELYESMVNPVADSRPDHKSKEPHLFNVVREEFARKSILKTGELIDVPHPIVPHGTVKGKIAPHPVSFVQSGRQLTVMQTVNLTAAKTTRTIGTSARAAAYMFKDVAAEHDSSRIKTIALVNSSPASTAEENEVGRAFDILKDAATEIVDWSDMAVRQKFIDERLSVAFHAA